MASDKITIYVNDKPQRFFLGAQVKHAIGTRAAKAVRAHRAVVRDAAGNSVDVDGALAEGTRLYVTPTTPTEFADEVLRHAPRGKQPCREAGAALDNKAKSE